MIVKPILPLQLLFAPSPNDPQPLILYHGKGCSDGFAAALAAWIFYQGQAEFIGLDHGQVQALADLPPVAGRAVYILDFSFPAEILRGIEESAAKLVLLDHHKSAAEKLSGFNCRCGVVHFDMSKSGARLAWEFFQPEQPLPDLVRFIEDRDIWAWQYAESGAFLSALDMEAKEFVRWQEIANFGTDQVANFMARGAAMDEKYRKLCADLAEGAQPLTFNGVEGLMVNAPGMFHSLVGDLLSAKSGTFALMWSAGQGGAVKCGLRSQRNFDCIVLAESMGGGGHAQACGFRMGVERLPELLGGVFAARSGGDARPAG
ncbi:DHH family phosphoesterase [Roseateles oligotrophus]|uniref:DHHA1 domain-containing protein n=1 Tax=Roseateles oligotrophus TaxID=1769250 RepID=A0ABT2YB90_9BURK|nr:DHHA1 domain-containing protein [Roseateles oligotrophus]MCV2367570.1 DHHA1 domain-containing protein [Roseateles oligotrophus]